MDRQYARISEAAATGIRDMEIYRGKIISVASETVALPNGRTLEMEVVHHPGGAAAGLMVWVAIAWLVGSP